MYKMGDVYEDTKHTMTFVQEVRGTTVQVLYELNFSSMFHILNFPCMKSGEEDPHAGGLLVLLSKQDELLMKIGTQEITEEF